MRDTMTETTEKAAPGLKGRIVIEDRIGTTIFDRIDKVMLGETRLFIDGSVDEIIPAEDEKKKPSTKSTRQAVSIAISTLIKTPHLTVRDKVKCPKCGTLDALDRTRVLSFTNGEAHQHDGKISGCAECANLEAEARKKAPPVDKELADAIEREAKKVREEPERKIEL
jgi:hypothetical protein